MLIGYLAIGHRGTVLHLTDTDRSPRAQLLQRLGRSSARKIYRDLRDGSYRHVGYIVAGEWFDVHEVRQWPGMPV